MSGQVGDLSAKQQEIYKKFKENIKDVMQDDFDDYYLLRWLRARSWDVKKAEKMLRDSLAWRKKVQADKVLEWDIPEALSKYYPGGYFGEDKEGCPLWFDTLGTVDLKGMFFSVKKSDIVKYKVYYVEKLNQKMLPVQTAKKGKRVMHCSIIFDMEGIGMKHLWKPAVEAFSEILKTFEANYPETLKICYVIKAPAIFPIAYNLVKPFLSEDTKKKIRILGRDWKSVLQKDIEADQLPKNWGGTATDPDGDTYCKSHICMGGKIPESLYQVKPDVDMSNFTTITVARGSSEQIAIDVTKPGQILSWQFWTDNMDLGFGVFRRTANERQKASEMEEVVASERVNSHIIPEDGSLKLTELGTYVLRFDNTYSWVNSKKVSYLLELLEPDDLEELHVNPKDITESTLL